MKSRLLINLEINQDADDQARINAEQDALEFQINRDLQKYRENKEIYEARHAEWDILYSTGEFRIVR